MYDGLTARYTFACPVLGEARVALSAFRRLERLGGASHPAVYRVSFACPCGDEHPGLVTHNELDWAPLGLVEGVFLNLMTARLEQIEDELAELTASRIQAGEWPWSFFCYPEEQQRPVYPSAFRLLTPAVPRGRVGVAVRCPACGAGSINLVSRHHLDVPFHNDAEIGVVEHVFEADAERAVEAFAAELDSARFDARRLALQ